MTERPDTATDAPTYTAWLLPHGRRPWTEIRPLLAGCTCAWADLDGLHTEPPPAGPPLATHLWAWNDSRLLRVRIDGGDGIAAELRLTDPGHGEPVTVTEREVPGWPSNEGRVSAPRNGAAEPCTSTRSPASCPWNSPASPTQVTTTGTPAPPI